MIDYAASIADIHIIEKENIGYAKGHNKLMRAATGDYICLIDNDVLLDKNWLKDLLFYNKTIERSGFSAIHTVLDKGEFNNKFKIFFRPDNLVYSTKLFSRSFLNDVGGFDESFSKYGGEDTHWAWRADNMNYINYYIPNQFSVHLGHDYNSNSDYSKFKSKQLNESIPKVKAAMEEMKKKNNFRVKL